MEGTEGLVNVVDPDTLEVGSIPSTQLPTALAQGYTEATPEETTSFINKQKYGTLGQQAITGLEGAAQAATFGLSTGVERALGVPEEDIIGRRKENPVTHMVGQGAGLVGTAFVPGGGTAGLLTKAGRAGSEALGLTGASTAARVGSAATQGAIENMLVQGGDEISKMLASDPDQSVETAAVNMGLSGVLGGGLGGAIGGVNPLWSATMGPKLSRALEAIQGKAGGVEGLAPDVIDDIIQKTGLDLKPEIRGALSKDPRARQIFQTLQESSTNSGLKSQEITSKFKSDLGDLLLNSFGKTADDVDGLVHLSDYDAGKMVQSTLTKDLKARIDPLTEGYEKISSSFKDIELPQNRMIYPGKKDPYTGEFTQAAVSSQGTVSKIADDVTKLAQEKGYNISPSAPEARLVDRVLTELPNLKTLEDLRNYQSLVSGSASQGQMWDLGKNLKNIFRNAEEDLIALKLGESAPEMLAAHQASRQGYREMMNVIDDLNSRLHVGRYGGPASFVKALSEMSPEDVLRRLSGKGDADLLKTLSEQFPSVANELRDYQIKKLLKNASEKAGPGEAINPKALIKSYEKMSPELRSFVLGQEARDSVQAVQGLMDALPSKMNTSGTAKSLDALWNKIPGSAVAMAQLAFGNNPIMALPLGYLTNLISRDAPDAVRLSLLKFLGTNQQADAAGFKAMVDFVKNTIKGENLIGKTTKNVFKSGAQVLPQALFPSQTHTDRLDKQLKALQENENGLLDIGGKVPAYLPKEGTALAQLGANAVNYLNSLRPAPAKQSPLDPEPQVTPEQKNAYVRALQIAEQPLVVVEKIKDGTLLPQDMMTLKTVYPALYTKLASQLTQNLMDAVSNDVKVPYPTRMSLSLFLGQPLDSTLLPMNIQAAQIQAAIAPMQGPMPARRTTAALGKLPPMYATGSQAREAHRAMK